MSELPPRERKAPWLEGLLLAGCVALLLWMPGGNATAVSYHGLYHAGIAQSIADGFPPEDPYFAGEPLHYYYAWQAAVAGIAAWFGVGPLFSIQLLNLLAALLFALGLDAAGRAAGLSHAARRWAFPLAVLGFNGAGWLGGLFSWSETRQLLAQEPALPALYALQNFQFGWETRNLSFLSKLLNASSHALALGPALFAIAPTLAEQTRPSASGWLAPLRGGAWLALTLALNPVIGFAVGLAMAAARFARPQSWSAFRPWIVAALFALLLAAPFLWPLFGGDGESAAIDWRWLRIWNLVGPGLALLPLLWLGLHWERLGPARGRLLAALAAVGWCAIALALPLGNEYKFIRIFWMLAALPCGAQLASWLSMGRGRSLAVLYLLLLLPTTAATAWQYARVGRQVAPVAEVDGVLLVRGSVRDPESGRRVRPWIQAIRTLPADAVLVDEPALAGGWLGGMVIAQGSPLVPLTSRSLFTDRADFHGVSMHGMEAVGQRIALGNAAQRGEPDALRAIGALFQGRPVYLLRRPGAEERNPGSTARLEEALGGPVAESAGLAIYHL